MSTPPSRVRRALAVLVVGVAAVALGAGPAAAHDEIVGTTPADGSTVDVAPDQVVLTFAEPAIALGTRIVVTGPDGSAVSQGDVTLAGSTVVQALAPARPAGAYRVDWRVTSADGHPVSGTFTFTASSGTPVVAATSPAATPSPAATTPPAATATATAAPSSPAVTAPPGGQRQDPASDTRTLVGIAILVLVVLALVVVRIGRARSLRRLTAADRPGAGGSSTDDAGPAGGA